MCSFNLSKKHIQNHEVIFCMSSIIVADSKLLPFPARIWSSRFLSSIRILMSCHPLVAALIIQSLTASALSWALFPACLSFSDQAAIPWLAPFAAVMPIPKDLFPFWCWVASFSVTTSEPVCSLWLFSSCLLVSVVLLLGRCWIASWYSFHSLAAFHSL